MKWEGAQVCNFPQLQGEVTLDGPLLPGEPILNPILRGQNFLFSLYIPISTRIRLLALDPGPVKSFKFKLVSDMCYFAATLRQTKVWPEHSRNLERPATSQGS